MSIVRAALRVLAWASMAVAVFFTLLAGVCYGFSLPPARRRGPNDPPSSPPLSGEQPSTTPARDEKISMWPDRRAMPILGRTPNVWQ